MLATVLAICVFHNTHADTARARQTDPMFCLSCGSALDEYDFCAHCEAFADTLDGMSAHNEVGPCPRCGETAQLRTSREPSIDSPSDVWLFSVLHLVKSEECPDYDEPA